MFCELESSREDVDKLYYKKCATKTPIFFSLSAKMEQAIFVELEMNSLRDIQPRITANLQEMYKCYEIKDWPAFKDLALSCQILTIRQIESYNRLLKKSTSIDMTNQLQLNLESSNENLVQFKTITRQTMKLKNDNTFSLFSV